MRVDHEKGNRRIADQGSWVSLTLSERLVRAYRFSRHFQGTATPSTVLGKLLPFLALAVFAACFDPVVRSFGLHLGLELKGL